MSKRRYTLSFASLLSLATAAIATASPAMAADGFETATASAWSTGSHFCVSNGTTPSNQTAVGCFRPSGDQIEPGDTKVDGRRVGVRWKTSDGRSGMCVNTAGKDAVFDPVVVTSPAQGGHQCNKDFTEGISITYRVGTCDASVHSCNVLANWSEWSGWITRGTNE
ncbi:hypothetical protein SAMN05443575_0103 [Jatrophihabitans endophyticus]|uniref:Ig-like domain-containing protein n=1 Tax=Jatrophihabitans endophyticus TaxID=1206085 RepID=A0A1M5C4P4_9ACTN|nr:hypothetical protein [Jatrophihabitans endophyticus]SHF49650.1 hypothetical protein SAMN05443575_0103 [Jatrophihabitans endophyticus]